MQPKRRIIAIVISDWFFYYRDRYNTPSSKLRYVVLETVSNERTQLTISQINPHEHNFNTKDLLPYGHYNTMSNQNRNETYIPSLLWVHKK